MWIEGWVREWVIESNIIEIVFRGLIRLVQKW
jgi:hypothetical protein